MVTEPTLSALHDADRVIKVTRHFKIPARVVINKCDLNPAVSRKIEFYCRDNGVPLIGKMRFDKSAVKAIVEGKTIPERSSPAVKRVIEKIWQELSRI